MTPNTANRVSCRQLQQRRRMAARFQTTRQLGSNAGKSRTEPPDGGCGWQGDRQKPAIGPHGCRSKPRIYRRA